MTSPRPVATFDLSPHPGFLRDVDLLRPRGEPATTRNQLRLLRRILGAALRQRPLILYSSRGSLKPDLLACLIISCWPRRLRPPTVMVGELWEPTSGSRVVVERLVVRLADRSIDRYLVLSQAEAELLPRMWPLDRSKLRVRPFYFEPAEHGIDGSLPARGRTVVAGGDSLRDYGPLLEAARRLPDVPFLLVTKKVIPGPHLPPNVEVRSVPYTEYVAALRDAGVVAVPVRRDVRRSAGILTFLMAMHLGKPTVVTDALAVDEYIQDGITGILVDGSVQGWVTALRRLLEDDDEADRLASAARSAVTDAYSLDRYARGILAEVEALVLERAN